MNVLVKGWKNLTWYVGEIMGDSAYERYLARHNAVHSDVTPMTEREFWRDRVNFDETNHSTGCC
ncbi:MAG: YbdD/YjiX family protein [Ruaniaceae bacterium]|nr:YbdD/YjiX family protein [Ruaniaceae bacterium]